MFRHIPKWSSTASYGHFVSVLGQVSNATTIFVLCHEFRERRPNALDIQILIKVFFSFTATLDIRCPLYVYFSTAIFAFLVGKKLLFAFGP